jgi:FKBP-type peptidyl-prolyl cis-trans isomerase (trigger factor)
MSAQRRQVADALAAKVDFPLPDSLVDSEIVRLGCCLKNYRLATA